MIMYKNKIKFYAPIEMVTCVSAPPAQTFNVGTKSAMFIQIVETESVNEQNVKFWQKVEMIVGLGLGPEKCSV